VSHPNDPYAQHDRSSWPGAQGQPPYQGSYQQNPYQSGPQPTQQFDPQYPYGQPGGWYGNQDPYGQGGYGQQYGGPQTPPLGAYGPLPPQQQQPPRKRTGPVVGSLVAVIMLVAVGVATYFFAFAGSASGAPTPKEAAVDLINALSKNDLVGLLDGLAPAEGAVAKDYLTDSLKQLKRLGVVKPDTRPEQITGIAFKAEELVFDDAAEEKVNEHLVITKLVDGKVTISSDWSAVPLTEKFLEKAFPDGVPSNRTETIDVSNEIAKSNDGKPVRIATIEVDGEWYPSLFYSIADAALQEEGENWPARSIGAVGADSPESAVRQFVEAVLRNDVKRMIELTPPDEMAALHDVGQLLIDAAEGDEPTGITLRDLRTKVEDVAGGKRVSITRLVVENDGGQTFTLEVDGDCVKVDDDGDRNELCGKDLAEGIAELAELGGRKLSDDQLGAIERVAVGYLHSGLVTTQVDGTWYVSPSRSIGDISTGFLRTLQPGDLETLIDLFR
jgi:hypothetical protein